MFQKQRRLQLLWNIGALIPILLDRESKNLYWLLLFYTTPVMARAITLKPKLHWQALPYIKNLKSQLPTPPIVQLATERVTARNQIVICPYDYRDRCFPILLGGQERRPHCCIRTPRIVVKFSQLLNPVEGIRPILSRLSERLVFWFSLSCRPGFRLNPTQYRSNKRNLTFDYKDNTTIYNTHNVSGSFQLHLQTSKSFSEDWKPLSSSFLPSDFLSFLLSHCLFTVGRRISVKRYETNTNTSWTWT